MSVMWSPLESKDGPGRHSASVDTPCPGCASTTRQQQMTNKTETFCGCSRFTLCKRVVYTSPLTESRVSPSGHPCSATHPMAEPMAEQVMVLDSDSVGSEESLTMLNVPAESAATQQEQQFLLDSYGIFRLLASRVRKHDVQSFECFQTSSRRSR